MHEHDHPAAERVAGGHDQQPAVAPAPPEAQGALNGATDHAAPHPPASNGAPQAAWNPPIGVRRRPSPTRSDDQARSSPTRTAPTANVPGVNCQPAKGGEYSRGADTSQRTPPPWRALMRRTSGV